MPLLLLMSTLLFSSSLLAQEDKKRYNSLLVKKRKISVYPIPANEAVFIEMDSIDLCQVKLYNSFGKRAIAAIPESSLNKLELQTNHLNEGNYILQIIKNNTEIITKRIVVKH